MAGAGGKAPAEKSKKYLKKQGPQRTIMVFLRAKGMYPLNYCEQPLQKRSGRKTEAASSI
jgi:hypothetical protein